MILDLEFKRFKTREIREEVRQDYDNLRSRLHVLNEQIKSQTENPPIKKEETTKLNDEKALLERDIERRKKQVESLDLEVEGSKPTSDYPDGVQGIDNQLDALHELLGMIRAYIREELQTW